MRHVTWLSLIGGCSWLVGRCVKPLLGTKEGTCDSRGRVCRTVLGIASVASILVGVGFIVWRVVSPYPLLFGRGLFGHLSGWFLYYGWTFDSVQLEWEMLPSLLLEMLWGLPLISLIVERTASKNRAAADSGPPGSEGILRHLTSLHVAALIVALATYTEVGHCVPHLALYAVFPELAFLWQAAGIAVVLWMTVRLLRRWRERPAVRWAAIGAAGLVVLGSSGIVMGLFIKCEALFVSTLGGRYFLIPFQYFFAQESLLNYLGLEGPIQQYPALAALHGFTGRPFFAIPTILVATSVFSLFLWAASDLFRVLVKIERNFRLRASCTVPKPSRDWHAINFLKYSVWVLMGLIACLLLYRAYVPPDAPSSVGQARDLSPQLVLYGVKLVSGFLSVHTPTGLSAKAIRWVLLTGLAVDLAAVICFCRAYSSGDSKRNIRTFFALRIYCAVVYVVAWLTSAILLLLAVKSYLLGPYFYGFCLRKIEGVIGPVSRSVHEDLDGRVLLMISLIGICWFFMKYLLLRIVGTELPAIEANTRQPDQGGLSTRYWGAKLYVAVMKTFAYVGAGLLAVGLTYIAHRFARGTGEFLFLESVVVLVTGTFYVIVAAMPELVQCLLYIESHLRLRDS
ncbi:MAG: hypothetical protein GY851_24280 [bacterium]|nr:hypothetical protein [bacterium]